MSARFEVSHATSGARGVRDILHRQLETGIDKLPEGEPTDAQIHQARKHLKAARATLRLLRPVLSERAWRKENSLLRAAARSLSAARDGSVLVSTLGKLRRRVAGANSGRDLDALQKRLRHESNRRRRELARNGLRRTAAQLRAAIAAVGSWPSPPTDWKTVRDALRESYRKGRRCARSNARQRSGRRLHEWRKRAKDLRSQLEVLAPVQHATLKSMSDELHQLADYLGDEHDLAVLRDIAQHNGRGIAPKTQARLQHAISRKRRKLRKRALAVGLPLYAEKPGRFETRLRRYFRHGRKNQL